MKLLCVMMGMIVVSAVGWGQGPIKILPPLECRKGQHLDLSKNGDCVDDPKPLKCGKLEHVEEMSACGSGPRPAFIGCSEELHKVCAPDMHTLTEKEWQELMARLNTLEVKNK